MERRLPTSSAVIQNEAERPAEARSDPFTQYENYQREWMEKTRGTLMLVATVIAGMTFQIATNPPGGVWQESKDNEQVGTSVLADSTDKSDYEIFIILCTISFSASLTIIFLLICGIPPSNRAAMWVLTITMCISVSFTAAAYIYSIRMVMKPLGKEVHNIAKYYAFYWVGLTCLVFLILLIRLVFWLMKKLLIAAYRAICCLIGLCKCGSKCC